MSGVHKVTRDNELIEQAAADWLQHELEDWLKPTPLTAIFSDGAYWMKQQIEAGRIKVKVREG